MDKVEEKGSVSRDHAHTGSSALEEAIASTLVDYMHDVAIGSFNATNSAMRAARTIAGMLKPGNYLDRIVSSETRAASAKADSR